MTLRQRPGDQPLPTPGEGPGMHDLLISDLRRIRRRYGTSTDRLAAELAARRDLGLTRYGSLLRPGNGRDALRDLLDELLDAMAYARQARLEGAFASIPDDGQALESMAAGIASAVVELMDARPAVTA